MDEIKIKLQVSVVVEPDGGSFFGWSPDLEGVFVDGVSRKDAKSNLKRAILLHLETMLINGVPLPKTLLSEHDETRQTPRIGVKPLQHETEEIILAFA